MVVTTTDLTEALKKRVGLSKFNDASLPATWPPTNWAVAHAFESEVANAIVDRAVLLYKSWQLADKGELGIRLEQERKTRRRIDNK